MSTIRITIETIESIHDHPNADRLEIAHILGTQTIVGKGEFKAGDEVVFFPPDILLPPDVSVGLGVQKYLKHALWEDGEDVQKCQCRVAACRLRGIPSYGFVAPVPAIIGWDSDDLTDYYRAVKYEPPVKLAMAGDALAEPPNFPRYTDIEHYYKFSHVIQPGTPVRVTEKTHGTNCRLGSVQYDGLTGFFCGSHRTAQREESETGRKSLYWEPLRSDPRIQTALQELSVGEQDVVIYCEIFGPGIQDMDYGIRQGKIGFRVFDISINGRYMDWGDLHTTCLYYGLQLVPVIYVGPFDPEKLDEWTNGPTMLADEKHIKSKFKGREGCVITPLTETYHPDVGRVVLKSVSADYLDRRGATDNG